MLVTVGTGDAVAAAAAVERGRGVVSTRDFAVRAISSID